MRGKSPFSVAKVYQSLWKVDLTHFMKMEELAKVAAVLQVNVGYFFPAEEKITDNRPPVVDKRLRAIIDIYPSLSDYTKDIIDAIIKVARTHK